MAFAFIGWMAVVACSAWLLLAGVAAMRVSFGFCGRISWIGIGAILLSIAGFYALFAYGPVLVTLLP